MPGRTFASPADFNAQLTDWLAEGEHPARALLGGARSTVAADRAAMLALPPVAPTLGLTTGSGSVGTTTCASMPATTPSTRGDRPVRRCAREPGPCRSPAPGSSRRHARCWATAATITDPAHVEAAQLLRADLQRRDQAPDPAAGTCRDRDLSDYDARSAST